MLTFFTPFDVKVIQISTFPAAPSTERVPSLAERVASLRYSINLQLLNNRVPGLLSTHFHENTKCNFEVKYISHKIDVTPVYFLLMHSCSNG